MQTHGWLKFQERAFKFWLKSTIASREWLNIDRHEGVQNIPMVFMSVLNGDLAADHGVVVNLTK